MNTISKNILSAFIEAVSATAGKCEDAESRLTSVFQQMRGLADSDRAAVLDDLLYFGLSNVTRQALKLVDDDDLGDEICAIRAMAKSDSLSEGLISALECADAVLEQKTYPYSGHASPYLTRWMVSKNLVAAEDAAADSEKKELALFRAGLLNAGWWR